jgi:hypothetical protein
MYRACLGMLAKSLCTCGSRISGASTDHSMRCSALAAQTTLQLLLLTGILRRAVRQAGIASTLEPSRWHHVGRHHTDTQAMLQGCAKLSTLELESSGEGQGQGVEPS